MTGSARLSRREFLSLCGGGAATLVLPRAFGLDTEVGPLLVEPRNLTSRHGVLDVTLRAAATLVPSRAGERYALTYAGTSPGPTLRVQPGDRLRVTLENHLSEATNLHTHGLHVSPEGDADDVFAMVPPGGSRTYVYDIPADHRGSMCWYHPHHHGLVASQLGGGLFGAIVVEDPLDRSEALRVSRERVLLLHDPVIGGDARVLDATAMEVMWGREGTTALVNGLDSPVMRTRVATLERWRLLNASPSRYYRLALEGHRLALIGTDGGRLRRPLSLADLLLAPGERAEVLVAPSRGGSYRLRTLGYDRGRPGGGGMGQMGGGATNRSVAQTLATLEVLGTGRAARLPARLDVAAPALPNPSRQQRFELSMGGMGRGMGMMSFAINGRGYDDGRTDTTAQLGATEEWVVSNTSTMDHPFHLHTWPFQVVERSAGPADPPGWKDTVNVPANGTVRLRVRFADFAGRTVYHCHILDHEDQGMMGTIEVR